MSNPIDVIRLEPLAVRPKEAASLIGVSPRKFAEMRSSGLLPPAYKLGGCLIYRLSDLKKWTKLGFPCLDQFLALQRGVEKCTRH